MKSGPGSHGMRRADHVAIAQFIKPGELVLDVGCGDGQLMELLQTERGARTRGLEVEQAGVNRCVAKGIAVVQGDCIGVGCALAIDCDLRLALHGSRFGITPA